MMPMQDVRAERRPADPRPRILVTPDLHNPSDAPTEREYRVRANYAEAVAAAGGLILILPYDIPSIPSALDLADGVIITGSMPGTLVEPERSTYEREVVRLALAKSKPLLEICHGMQLLGECLGGTFATELPVSAETSIEHMPSPVPDRGAHRITIAPGSRLARLCGTLEVEVNSLHRHTLTGVGRFRAVARADDGVIEAFEGKTAGFCLGIQWHPEYHLTALDRAIFRDFVEECRDTGRVPSRDTVAERLAQLSLALPEVSTPPGTFVGAVRTGNLVTVSGQVPIQAGAVIQTGRLGDVVSIEDGRECARWALLNALTQLNRVVGSLDRVRGFVRLAGYVAATPGFARQGAVIDGASELLREIFPDCWQHARLAIGVASLPRNAPVEIELTAIVDMEGAPACAWQ